MILWLGFKFVVLQFFFYILNRTNTAGNNQNFLYECYVNGFHVYLQVYEFILRYWQASVISNPTPARSMNDLISIETICILGSWAHNETWHNKFDESQTVFRLKFLFKYKF